MGPTEKTALATAILAACVDATTSDALGALDLVRDEIRSQIAEADPDGDAYNEGTANETTVTEEGA